MNSAKQIVDLLLASRFSDLRKLLRSAGKSVLISDLVKFAEDPNYFERIIAFYKDRYDDKDREGAVISYQGKDGLKAGFRERGILFDEKTNLTSKEALEHFFDLLLTSESYRAPDSKIRRAGDQKE